MEETRTAKDSAIETDKIDSKKEGLNIALSFDDNYVLPARVMMKSLARFHHNINLYLVYSNISDKNLSILNDDIKSYGWNKYFIALSEVIINKLQDAPVTGHFSKAMYYRL